MTLRLADVEPLVPSVVFPRDSWPPVVSTIALATVPDSAKLLRSVRVTLFAAVIETAPTKSLPAVSRVIPWPEAFRVVVPPTTRVPVSDTAPVLVSTSAPVMLTLPRLAP